ncbi:ASCH/PUA domain-containing protein [Bradyrhizobium elkanii]|uniref:ASCH/PUA domain-containing protein n=1 Tax=Bradyrhizobium elkanii TaxID=29448 RepID=UPI00216A7753|nr:ASCH/PUA domain-containing protein [Bradyrhizobium elkanii]MCS3690985.1 hypothetical protein [Bradyrhizobium elkanii]
MTLLFPEAQAPEGPKITPLACDWPQCECGYNCERNDKHEDWIKEQENDLEQPHSDDRRAEDSTMKQHDLKVWPDYFDAIADGRKPFEIRKNDRDFQCGDVLRLREYSPGPDEFTGREITRTVSYMLSGDDVMGAAFGLQQGFVALGLSRS